MKASQRWLARIITGMKVWIKAKKALNTHLEKKKRVYSEATKKLKKKGMIIMNKSKSEHNLNFKCLKVVAMTHKALKIW